MNINSKAYHAKGLLHSHCLLSIMNVAFVTAGSQKRLYIMVSHSLFYFPYMLAEEMSELARKKGRG